MKQFEISEKFIRPFDTISMEDLSAVGGKNASLGEMIQTLSPMGIRVPGGFAITADAYWHFLNSTDLGMRIQDWVTSIRPKSLESVKQAGAMIRQAILSTALPSDLSSRILEAYRALGQKSDLPPDVAVRSSSTAEDLPTASFAGQQETFLNVQGETALLDACRRCYASLFTDRAISYRSDMGFDHMKIALSIGVQRMVRSDLACAGVMFSIDTETGFQNAVLINASYGLGESVVQGSVNPDEIYVFKPTLLTGHRPILQKRIGSKEFKLIYDTGGTKAVRNVPVSAEERAKLCLEEDEILTLSRWACVIEDHYSKKQGKFTPMDIEWAKDGNTRELFIVQARPETVQSRKSVHVLERFSLKGTAPVRLTGRSVGEKIATGKVRVIREPRDLGLLKMGEVLVTEKTDPDWEPSMKRAAAIVTDRGGRTCHAAIVSRELGLPAIVGTETGTSLLKDGEEITVSCAEGETGKVYEGKVRFEVEQVSLDNLERPKTKVMMIMANPDEAFRLSFIPNDGVGLVREEFIISNSVQIHPMALLEPEKVPDAQERAKISELTRKYPSKSAYFVDKLAEGVGMIAAAFYPKDVIVRLSDFKTNEYAGLIGGSVFEPKEENPMLGFRGASRYYHPRYQTGFALECQAMKKVRNEMGLTNLKLMIPFCRTLEEGKKVISEMEKNGLKRGDDGLEVYVMCEIPSNVILAEEFAEIFDGFSIGSNDLTQLLLGVDRDSEIVAPIFDERNSAVKTMIAQVIRAANSKGRKIGICGQAPSDYPEFAQFLVQQGIGSISLNPDAVLKMTLIILDAERRRSTNLKQDGADPARTLPPAIHSQGG